MIENNARISFANRLQYYREQNNLTLKELGDLVGKSDKTISAWEHGRGQPDIDMLILLCDILLVKDLNVFLRGQAIDATRTAIDDFDDELLRAYRALDTDGQRMVCRMLELTHPATRRDSIKQA